MTAKLIAALSLALAFAGLGLWGQHEHLAATKAKAEVKTLQTRNEAIDGALKAAAKDAKNKDDANLLLRQELDRAKADSDKSQKELNDALKANREWADTRLPDGVRNALRARGADPKAGRRVDAAGARPRTPGR